MAHAWQVVADAPEAAELAEPSPPLLPTAAAGEWLDVPETLGYRLKRRLLGPPLINDQLQHERLSNPIALGVLSPDCISSSAYGTEEMLIELLKGGAAFAAFWMVLPLTGVILGILLLLTLSYRQVVMIYTRAGGSYVVARENFGPRIAQIAAVALLIDYVVTVAVQTAAGTVAVASAVPSLGPYSLEITVGVVLLLCYGNLRGIREAGRSFAVPTYLFAVLIGLVIVLGVIKALLGTLPQIDPTTISGTYPIEKGTGPIEGVTLLVLLRSFANGGSSLTGLEAISNGVSAFRPPEGRNARKAMVYMACTLGFLVAGVSFLAWRTHATPHTSGYPSVLSQEAKLVLGSSFVGHALYGLVQVASALILYTGANTSFNGFPFLASFVAEDQFLPRQLRRRGHRLVFSNAIIVLTITSVLLLLATNAKVNSLVPFYAIGVFTGFTMAGLGMARHFQREGGPGSRSKVALNLAAGIASLVVVAIFAIAKFAEGAWLVVIIFPVMVMLLIRLNRQYREEAAALATLNPEALAKAASFAKHNVLVFVDHFDLATVEAVRYGRSLNPSDLRAVHFVLDSARAERLQRRWSDSGARVPLELVDCPDRRLFRASVSLITRQSAPRTETTVLLPRRSFTPILGRLLHDRTADRLARVISRVPNAAATIIPFDTEAHLRGWTMTLQQPNKSTTARRADPVKDFSEPPPPADADPIGHLVRGQSAVVQGRVRSVRVTPIADTPVLAAEVVDSTGSTLALFYGRRQIPGIEPGACVRLQGRPTTRFNNVVMNNPRYELVHIDPHPKPGDQSRK
jgi:amino acid transporter